MQDWCTDAIGMWGHSYGAATTLRAASRQPSQLKAIVPVLAYLDPERDFVHPHGIRGCLGPIGTWGLLTMLTQMLPPMRNHTGAEERRRWQERLAVEPWLLDMFRLGAGDPRWRSRAIDATQVTAPALCIAGWRDLFVDSTIRAFEQINGPKHLLVGPWMHTMPHVAPEAPADFRRLALRWWDRWLLGVDNGVMDEPPVTVYVQGSAQPWRQYASWPPPSDPLELAADGVAGLSRASDRAATSAARS